MRPSAPTLRRSLTASTVERPPHQLQRSHPVRSAPRTTRAGRVTLSEPAVRQRPEGVRRRPRPCFPRERADTGRIAARSRREFGHSQSRARQSAPAAPRRRRARRPQRMSGPARSHRHQNEQSNNLEKAANRFASSDPSSGSTWSPLAGTPQFLWQRAAAGPSIRAGTGSKSQTSEPPPSRWRKQPGDVRQGSTDCRCAKSLRQTLLWMSYRPPGTFLIQRAPSPAADLRRRG
jgi:hypothetical protein